MPAKGGHHTEETRRRISQRKMEHDRRVLEARDPTCEPAQKPCSTCGEWRPLKDFGVRKHRTKTGAITVYPRSECKDCEVERNRRYKARKEEEGVWKEMRTRYEAKLDKEKRTLRERERKAAKRRELGVPLRRPKARRLGPSIWTEGLPVGPIREFLEDQIESGSRNVSQIEWATGINHRQISGILRSEYPTVTLGVVDRLLVGLGYPEELHFLYPAEDEPDTEVGYAYFEPDELRTAA